MNAQSIPAHFPDILSSFVNNNIPAILISESWLKPLLPSMAYTLLGYHLIRSDRIQRSGGGVAIYLRSQIPFNIVNVSLHNACPEHLFIEITLSNTKIL